MSTQNTKFPALSQGPADPESAKDAARTTHDCASYWICLRCVMDTSDPEIVRQPNGYCNHCTDYLDKRVKLLHRDTDNGPLLALFDRIREAGKGRAYDCVVGVSGGVDSSYVAYLAVRHGLRVLAVHMDNGWNSPIAVENINNLVKRLNLGYCSYVLPWNDFRKVQVAFLKASVPEAETPTDIAIQRAVHKTAAQHGVKYILSGGNIASEGILPLSWHYNARDTKYSYVIMDAAGCSRKLFRSQKFGLLEECWYKFGRGIRSVYPLNQLIYDKDVARVELEKECNWRYYGSKHGESRFTRFIQTYYLVAKHGIDYRRATLSSEICLGQIERTEALALLERAPFDTAQVESEITYIAKKLAITVEELRVIIAAPPRWYFDFPNNKKMLSKAYDLYRYVAGKQKTSSM
jgi:N-acetyl sugar amidotransferase